MSNPLPALLALTNIADASPRIAAPVRNNYSAIQAAVNALVTALSGGAAGALLYATDASDIAYLPEAPTDGQTLVWNAAAARWKPSSYGVGGQFDYAQLTGIVQTTANAWSSAILGNSVAYDGSRVRIETLFPRAFVQGLVQPNRISLFKDGVEIAEILGPNAFLPGPTDLWNVPWQFFDTPSAGNHIYEVKIHADGTNTTRVQGGVPGSSGTYSPAFLRVTKA